MQRTTFTQIYFIILQTLDLYKHLRFVHRKVCMVPDCEFTHNVIRNNFRDSIKLNEKILFFMGNYMKNMKNKNQKKSRPCSQSLTELR